MAHRESFVRTPPTSKVIQDENNHQQRQQQQQPDRPAGPGAAAPTYLPFPDNRLPPLKITDPNQAGFEKQKLEALEVPLGPTSLDFFSNNCKFLSQTSNSTTERAPPPPTPPPATPTRAAPPSANNFRAAAAPMAKVAAPTRSVRPVRPATATSGGPPRVQAAPQYRTATHSAQPVPVFAPVPVRVPYWGPYYYYYQQQQQHHHHHHHHHQRQQPQRQQQRRQISIRRRVGYNERPSIMQHSPIREQDQEYDEAMEIDMDSEELSITEDDTMVTDDVPTLSAVSARIAANHRNTSAAAATLTRPRWSADERLQLFLAVSEQKQLTDMSTFDWDKISQKFTTVERTNKSCKDQWRREVYKSIVKFLTDAAEQESQQARLRTRSTQ